MASEVVWTAETFELVKSQCGDHFVARDVLASLHRAGLLVTPEVTAVLEAARALVARLRVPEIAPVLPLQAAVDALEARPHPDTTGAAG